ncbi:hypothetical protein WICPIJ_001613 [Wickerhamomyces pijperi]|uniref:Riboflavin kinase n=1 Tax=Wickerhamomyces pijperi TaxID=599730 RepID=A0A9P8QD88_WICPI|nr:hypothetical protein WICPIJ_001613 [Wickerhamomyces pijperi]
MTRPDVIIPSQPQTPYPTQTEVKIPIIAGFGRGSSELGIPTANVSIDQLKSNILELEPGVYFGWCKVHSNDEHSREETKTRVNGVEVKYSYGLKLTKGKDLEVVLPMVMSIGWNPFYGNKEKAFELHIIHEFEHNFYGALVSFNVLGYIRPELNYTTKEALIKDIQTDIEIGLKTLETPEYAQFKVYHSNLCHSVEPIKVQNPQDVVPKEDNQRINRVKSWVLNTVAEISEQSDSLIPTETNSHKEEDQNQNNVVNQIESPIKPMRELNAEPSEVQERRRQFKQDENTSIILDERSHTDEKHYTGDDPMNQELHTEKANVDSGDYRIPHKVRKGSCGHKRGVRRCGEHTVLV